ncbi:isopentenyl-diphosphate Delta-isomerase [Biostraticola tofi]|uniref:Isopentenyl-diphosphate Delta-isomerase n=1 Tax=Biostraticola tofi TaxID=466109 RepID=A0A4R3YZ62_9GAMM|nr:isopentenyl-diphosphate Delta-isomerase [Biostraticola tofi]TCV98071.1 isopentenyl-diphosphate delta-isomerase [Biostraticola tofi]
MVSTQVLLVDEYDRPTGQMEKLRAHREGRLHRAVTVYIFNPHGELLLQRRAEDKYHCGGLWSNTCCSHPLPHEQTSAAAHRRLFEEMGMDATLTAVFNLQYRLPMPNQLIEHEYGHVFFGVSRRMPVINPLEAMGWRYASLTDIADEAVRTPENFTPWFRLTMSVIPRYYLAYRQLRQAG